MSREKIPKFMKNGGSRGRRESEREQQVNNNDKKSTSFWDVTPCTLAEVYRYFGGTHFLNIYCRKVSQKNPARIKQIEVDKKHYVPPKRR
jgi:hypothetical protein